MTVHANVATEQRVNPRFDINAPLRVKIGEQSVSGFTRNLSNRGVYFFLDSADGARLLDEIDFTVELPPDVTLTSSCFIRCQGRVLRRDSTANQLTGVATEILHYALHREDA